MDGIIAKHGGMSPDNRLLRVNPLSVFTIEPKAFKNSLGFEQRLGKPKSSLLHVTARRFY
ncbi:hypothetical protein [Pseudorhodobacter aquimaris]|uniref:hypothetical protein n=1 Tax=Pseudorhodobacter aquimaris TaxID=687412 RepID=UPI000B235E2E|nr:hypothetical protein [Pseudorhodobacter aquimaris]